MIYRFSVFGADGLRNHEVRILRFAQNDISQPAP